MKKKMLKEPNPETCPKCPRRYDPDGCEKWIGVDQGIIETNVETKEDRIMTGCFYQIVMRALTHVIAASNQSSASSDAVRNQLAGTTKLLLDFRDENDLDYFEKLDDY